MSLLTCFLFSFFLGGGGSDEKHASGLLVLTCHNTILFSVDSSWVIIILIILMLICLFVCLETKLCSRNVIYFTIFLMLSRYSN